MSLSLCTRRSCLWSGGSCTKSVSVVAVLVEALSLPDRVQAHCGVVVLAIDAKSAASWLSSSKFGEFVAQFWV